MAYDRALAERVRKFLSGERGITEKEMFGGIGFMAGGNLCCGVIGDELIVRVGPDGHAEARARPHTREFDFTGRPMKGWLVVTAEGCASKKELEAWVRTGLAFARTLPAKAPAGPRKRPT
jgi:TfoX/Sxy family transcriptional regulator of competence genes